MNPDTKWEWPNRTCEGTLVRQMCVFGVGDREMLMSAKNEGWLFANKFDDSFDSEIAEQIANI